jgi:hypothetical protein
MIKKIIKFFTGEFIDELFNMDSNSNNSMGDVARSSSKRSRRAQARAMVQNTKRKSKIFDEQDCV